MEYLLPLTAESEEPQERGRPLLVLHGGPGCTHDYLVSLCDLVNDNRSVIHYDQLGNGRSTHMSEAPYDFWTVDLFLRELENLISELESASTTSWVNRGVACWRLSMRCADHQGFGIW